MEQNETVGSGRIRSLFDAGSFVEVGAYVRGADGAAFDGVICGYGAVNGRLAFAFAQDADKMQGALDAPGAKKLKMLYDMAMKNGAPVVGVFDSIGASVTEGSTTLTAYGDWLKSVADASGILPQIAVVDGVCAGMSAVAANLFDFIVAVKGKASLYLLPKEDCADKKECTCRSCPAAKVCDTEADAFAFVRELVDLLPQNNRNKNVAAAPEIGALAENAVLPDALFDAKPLALYPHLGNALDVGFGRIGGETVGYVRAHGDLGCADARKAAHMVQFCDCFGVTLLTLVDSDGYAPDACPASFAKLAAAYASSSCPKMTLITGHACGAAFTLLGSRALGADLVFALENSVIAAMSPARAVAFLCNDRVTAEKSREAVEAEWAAENAAPALAAAKGDIDDIIPFAEVRMRLASGVYMLAAKAGSTPDRRHPVMPL